MAVRKINEQRRVVKESFYDEISNLSKNNSEMNDKTQKLINEIQNEIREMASSGYRHYRINDDQLRSYGSDAYRTVPKIFEDEGFTVTYYRGRQLDDRHKNPDYWEITW